MRLFAFLFALSLFAQPSQPPLSETERLAWFKESKFGIFFHWGAYSVIGRHEWARHRFQIPQAEYDKSAKQFNPVNFKPEEWVNIAQNAGRQVYGDHLEASRWFQHFPVKGLRLRHGNYALRGRSTKAIG